MKSVLKELLMMLALFIPAFTDIELMEVIEEVEDNGMMNARPLQRNSKANNGYLLDSDKYAIGDIVLVRFKHDDILYESKLFNVSE